VRVRVLLVEDDTILAKSESRALGSRGASVTIAHSFESARAELANGAWDAVILDLGLKDGWGCTGSAGTRLLVDGLL